MEVNSAIVISLIIVGVLFVYTVYTSPDMQKQPTEGLTQDEALYEHCLIENQLKYPLSSTATIERLCELEQIGRNMIQ